MRFAVMEGLYLEPFSRLYRVVEILNDVAVLRWNGHTEYFSFSTPFKPHPRSPIMPWSFLVIRR